MLFHSHLVLLRGGGDLATGVAYRLHKAGFPLVVLELPHPLVVRRRVALATAVLEGEITVEGLRAVRVDSVATAWVLAHTGVVPVLISPQIPDEWHAGPEPALGAAGNRPSVVIDARLAKRSLDTRIDDAPFVIGLGPGFTAGVDCHAVVETNRGHRLGRVIWHGAAEPNTGTPGMVEGKGVERVLRAPTAGVVTWRVNISDRVQKGELMGEVAGLPIFAPFTGHVRGLIAPGTAVPVRIKIGDVDPRDDISACFTISDKALSIGGGALEAILTYLSGLAGNSDEA